MVDKVVLCLVFDVVIYLECYVGMWYFWDGFLIVVDVLKLNFFVLGGDFDVND